MFNGFNKEKYIEVCTKIILEILNDENKIKSFAEKLSRLEKVKKDIFIKNFNDIILNNIKELNINIGPFYFSTLEKVSPLTSEEEINFLLSIYKGKLSVYDGGHLFSNLPYITSGTGISLDESIKMFESNMQLLLLELSKKPKIEKEKVLDIFYDMMGDELPNK